MGLCAGVGLLCAGFLAAIAESEDDVIGEVR